MRILALIKRIILQMLRDKRTMGLLFIAPLIVLTLMYLVFDGKEVEPVIGLEGESDEIIEQLKDADVKVEIYDDVSDIEDTILTKDLDGFLLLKEGEADLTLLNDDLTITKTLDMKVKQIVAKSMQLKILGVDQINGEKSSDEVVQTTYIYGSSDTVIFDVFSPVLVGFFVFFFVFLISGIGLLNERTTGTLERLMATPIKRGEIVAGYLLGYGLLALLQTVIIVLFTVHVLNIVIVGSVWHVIIINIVVAFVALSLGILLSSFASSEFQMMQFIPIVIVPQIFFSGIFDIDGMADWLQVFAKIMPLYYVGNALNGVMYKGLTLTDVQSNLYILIAFAFVFIILNLFALKKYRKL